MRRATQILILTALVTLGCQTIAVALPPSTTEANVSPTTDTLVLCAAPLKNALKPWLDYRRKQGHEILLLESETRSADNRMLIKAVAQQLPHIQHIVLVGDAADWRMPATALLPADHVLAKVNVNFGSEYDIATDNTYADFNGDSIPDAAIGRIAVSTPTELTAYIKRVIDYERKSRAPASADEQAWRRRINLIAGIGGFGQMTDMLIENTTRQIITDKIPGEYQTSMTHGSWRSPYCPDPRCFSDTAIERFNEGCMFWVYIGHGERTRLDALRVPKKQFSILDETSVKRLNCRNGNPIAIFLACYAGAYDSSRDCLAERMMKQPAGPIAVISGSRVTMPYAMGLLSLEMSEEFFMGESKTVGQLLLRSKQKMAAAPNASSAPMSPTGPEPSTDRPPEDPYRNMIHSMGLALSPLPEMLADEKTEHLHLINLLGDPLLRLKRPKSVALQTSQVVTAADGARSITVNGEAPVDGTLKLELVYRRDRFRKRPKRRRKFDPAEEVLAGYQTQYQQAHDLVCATKVIEVTTGRFKVKLKLEDDVKGDCRVRAMISGNTQDQFAIGSVDIDVARFAKSTDRNF